MGTNHSIKIEENVVVSVRYRSTNDTITLIVPSGVTTIGREAFKNCKPLTFLDLPKSLISIDDWALCGCSRLASLTLPENVTVECSDELPAVEMPMAEDNCDDEVEVELTEEIVPGDCPGNYTIQRVFRAFDNCGNQAVYMQEITVEDTTAPALEVAADVTIECDQEVPAADWTAADDCSEIASEVISEEVIPRKPFNPVPRPIFIINVSN